MINTMTIDGLPKYSGPNIGRAYIAVVFAVRIKFAVIFIDML